MPTFLNTAEGLTDNTLVTTANSGGTSGDAWNTVTTGTTLSTHRASDERAAHGTISYEMDHKAAGGAHRLMRNFVEAGRVVTTARYFLEDVPTDFEDFGGIRHSSGNMCSLTIGTDGKFIMANAAGSNISPASRSTAVVPTGQWITVQLEARKGTTTANGLIGYRYFLGTEPTGTPVFSWSEPASNAGTTDSAQVWWGRSTSRNQARIVWYDTLQAESLTSGWPAVYQAPNTAPSCVLLGSAFDLEPGDTQELAIVASDSDGTIASYSVTQLSGPTVTILGTGADRSYKVPPTLTGATLTFNATVVDDDGASTTSATITHTILPAAILSRVGGAWVPGVMRIRIGGIWV